MKNKKLGILIACVLVVVIAVASVVTAPLIKTASENSTVRKYTSQNLKNVDNVILLSHCIEIDGKTNSVAGVKEAVRLGAQAVAVDLCFRKDGTPVITDNYENVDSATTLEELYNSLSSDGFNEVQLYLNIVQLSEMSKLNALTVDHNMVGRTLITGIDEAHYGMITGDSTIIPFLLKHELNKDDKDAISDGSFSVPESIAQYGASGLEISANDASAEVVGALNDFGIPFIVSGIDSIESFCETLLNGASTVYVDDIEKYSGILDDWTVSMQERHSISVEQSLAELKKNK
ncbi:MAG: hypothetical protein J6A67_07690 [Clostridia bacterium]|nr:hypothetical protein [Clostridia bacterium]